jgi:hypothetical protein
MLSNKVTRFAFEALLLFLAYKSNKPYAGSSQARATQLDL